jgi:hypothetical protein
MLSGWSELAIECPASGSSSADYCDYCGEFIELNSISLTWFIPTSFPVTSEWHCSSFEPCFHSFFTCLFGCLWGCCCSERHLCPSLSLIAADYWKVGSCGSPIAVDSNWAEVTLMVDSWCSSNVEFCRFVSPVIFENWMTRFSRLLASLLCHEILPCTDLHRCSLNLATLFHGFRQS